ncbi:FIGNL1-interacting regulator of recombination and mitosis isoform X1 [Temnothorax americanus]|uniref:FIGNL1-interacting regulator of recombination and mitosis isoform X1 n=3 Tax=Temnothorax americanus TaxID=1964332 RepID=UPI0040687A8C
MSDVNDMDESMLSGLFDSSFEPTDFDDSEVSKLQALLEDKNLILDTECLLQTLEQCFSVCPIESLDERIFKKVLPKAQHFLSQIVKVIDEIITGNNVRLDDLDGIKYKLQVCDGLLAFWKKCVERISALEKVQAAYVASLCDILPETTRIIFEHCKDSAKYGALLSGAMQELRNLFAKACAVFKLFFATLNGIIVFDTDVQSETELLTKVVDAYGNIASIANGMDTKTFVELSEIFAKLVIVYQSEIKPYNIATHFIRMTKDVSYLLSAAMDQNDKNAERNVMVAMRLLRILEKLTSSYGASFTHEMMLDLVELLAQMHGYSCLIKSSERTILAGATSFLNIIFRHDNFKQVYFEYGRQNVPRDQYVRRLNYHLLTIAIMKKLNGMPFEHHCKWSLGSDSILDIAFTYIEHLEEEICVGDLRLSSVRTIGEGPRFVGIYEATLVSVCNLVSQILPEDFHVLELLLLKHLLSGHLWCSLLSSDVWCFIGRLGSSQLCIDHVKHLIKVSTALVERRDSIEAIMIDNMIVRLYDLLNEDVKSTLFDNLIDHLDVDYYVTSLHLLMANTKSLSSERLKRKIEDLPKAFSDLQEHPSTCNWKCLMQVVSAIIAVDYSDNKDVINVLTKLWSFVAGTIIESEGKQLDLLTDLVVTLLDATYLKNLHDESFYAILISVATSCVHLPPRGKIKICHFLQQNIKYLGRCGIQSIASILTELFSRLLEDENPWVRQDALETFEHVGHVCPEQLVAEIAKALAKILSISNVMQAYLTSKSYYVFKGFINMQDYLRYLAKAVQNHGDEHRCHEYNKMLIMINEHKESEREEKMPKLKKNSHEIISPMLTQLDEQAEKLYKGLTKVLEDQAVISEDICRRLITVLEKIIQLQGNENSWN